ncbi:ribonuclease M [Ahrensia sp. R2A130]|nr:ribonuclease M [Ahrensia sp. R2A130]
MAAACEGPAVIGLSAQRNARVCMFNSTGGNGGVVASYTKPPWQQHGRCKLTIEPVA